MTELQTHWFPSQKQDVLPAMLVPGSHSPWQHQAGKKMQDDFYWFLIFTPTISAHGQLKLCVWLCCDLNYSLCWVHCRLIRGCEPWSCFHKQLRLFFFSPFGVITRKNVNATRRKHCTGCTFTAHSLPCSHTSEGCWSPASPRRQGTCAPCSGRQQCRGAAEDGRIPGKPA